MGQRLREGAVQAGQSRPEAELLKLTSERSWTSQPLGSGRAAGSCSRSQCVFRPRVASDCHLTPVRDSDEEKQAGNRNTLKHRVCFYGCYRRTGYMPVNPF